jgi:serine/threonine-protein kinase
MGAHLILGRYEIVRLLGEGGMGRAYLARQRESDRLVVVKVPHEKLASDPQYRRNFQQEIDCLSRFRHPYAVELYESSVDAPDGPTAILEYVEGEPLDVVLARERPFRPARLGRLLGHLCAVLQAAHDRGIVHRDLKPANIMVVGAGSAQESLKVLDFGLARRVRDSSEGLYIPLEKFVGSRAHKAVGTLEYACPEQFRGEEVGPRGDLYSVGVMLFELLTGRLPFEGKTPSELIAARLHGPLPSLTDFAGIRRVSPKLEALVHGCLAENPEDRPESARELALRFGVAIGISIWNETEATLGVDSPPAETEGGGATESDNVDSFRLEAWMPQSIAAVKLRGFVDERGEVIDSVPGSLKVRLRMPRQAVEKPRPAGLLTRWGIGRKVESPPAYDLINVDLLTQAPDAARPSKLHVTVRLHPPDVRSVDDANCWFDWCKQVQIDLAGYLMARPVA